jgi:V/A-type H+/Na+-transporting ATPase subunit K
MEPTTISLFRDVGLASALSLAAAGSALGTGAAGQATIGAWKKCYVQGKAAPFILLAFVGAPLTQTLYGLILMNQMEKAVIGGNVLLGIGIFGGLAMGASAMMQGKAAASAADALAETGKGFVNYMVVLGIVETVALFVMVFLMGKIGAVAGI